MLRQVIANIRFSPLLGSLLRTEDDPDSRWLISEDAPVVYLNGRPFLIQEDYDSFHEAWCSLFLCTYRTHFEILPPSSLTSDAGWGCMLRSAQMLLAVALQKCYMSSDWYKERNLDGSNPNKGRCLEILEWFNDSKGNKCYYGIHSMCKLGLNYGMKPGEWYGPTIVSKVIRDTVNLHYKKGGKLQVWVSNDGVVYEDQIYSLMNVAAENDHKEEEQKLAEGNSSSSSSTAVLFDPLFNPPPTTTTTTTTSSTSSFQSWSGSLLLLFPVRLGLEEINSTYIHSLLSLQKLPQSIGFIGGHPSTAHYFPAMQGKNLAFLDPHIAQRYSSVNELKSGGYVSYQVTELRTMKVQSVDPSMSLGFFIKDRNDFVDFCKAINMISELTGKPVITSTEISPSYLLGKVEEMAATTIIDTIVDLVDDDGDDGFVII
jgi:cysteine protease ATG4